MTPQRLCAALTLLVLLAGPVGAAVCAVAVCATAADAPSEAAAKSHCGGGSPAHTPEAAATATLTDGDCCAPDAFDALAVVAKKDPAAAVAAGSTGVSERLGLGMEPVAPSPAPLHSPPDLLSLHATLQL